MLLKDKLSYELEMVDVLKKFQRQWEITLQAQSLPERGDVKADVEKSSHAHWDINKIN